MKIWKGITAGLLILFVGYNLVYRLGGEGVGVRGNSVSFGRQHDYQLFHINAGNAVLVSNSDSDATELSVVRTVGAPFPFSVLCGGFLSDGFTVDFKEIQNKSAISQRTITKKPHPTRGERDRVLVAMTPSEARAQLQSLSTCNESCMTFNAAFLFLFALALLALPVLLIRGRRAS